MILLKIISKIHLQFKNITGLKIDKIIEEIMKQKGKTNFLLMFKKN